ncbi:MAG: hypothetical protein HY320_00220 [Armatimonadetes bacterium]|nr:hypothetical protein [Armatimonadota bacterium]
MSPLALLKDRNFAIGLLSNFAAGIIMKAGWDAVGSRPVNWLAALIWGGVAIITVRIGFGLISRVRRWIKTTRHWHLLLTANGRWEVLEEWFRARAVNACDSEQRLANAVMLGTRPIRRVVFEVVVTVPEVVMPGWEDHWRAGVRLLASNGATIVEFHGAQDRQGECGYWVVRAQEEVKGRHDGVGPFAEKYQQVELMIDDNIRAIVSVEGETRPFVLTYSANNDAPYGLQLGVWGDEVSAPLARFRMVAVEWQ